MQEEINTGRAPGGVPPARDERLVRQLVALSYFLSFFPSLIYVIMPTQTQPIAAMVALPVLFLRPTRITALTLPAIVLLGIIVAYTIGTICIYPELVGAAIANGGSYASPLVLFLALQEKTKLLTPKPVLAAMGIWTVVAMIQAFPVPAGIKGTMQSLGRLMLERFVSGASSETRGYSLLASEPSLSAPTIVLMGLSIYYFRRQGKISWELAAIGYGVTLFMVVLNRSGTIGLLLASILFAFGVHALIKASGVQRLVALGSVVVILAGVVIGMENAEDNSSVRTLDVLKRLVDYGVDYVKGKPQVDVLTMLVLLGNQRIIPQVLAFGSLPQHYGIGHGIASWNLGEVSASVQDYVGVHYADYAKLLPGYIDFRTQDKPQSYAALLAYDTGMPGTLALLWLTYAVFFYRRRLIGVDGENRLIYLVPAFVWIAAMMTSTMPAPWILYVYSLHVARFPSRHVAVANRATQHQGSTALVYR